jgi:hypothetical protein
VPFGAAIRCTVWLGIWQPEEPAYVGPHQDPVLPDCQSEQKGSYLCKRPIILPQGLLCAELRILQ